METELPVEPQSLKKLSFKSLKRALDLFSPSHSQFPPPNPESKNIRLSYKLNAEYGSIGNTITKPSHLKPAAQQAPQASTTLALTGPKSSGDPPKGAQNELVVVPSSQPKGLFGSGDASFAGKSTTIIPAHGSSERNLSTAALMERIPSRWPRPVWRAPWKNYRVISGHLGWVRSVAFDPSNEWFCTGSADRTIKIWDIVTGNLNSYLATRVIKEQKFQHKQTQTILISFLIMSNYMIIFLFLLCVVNSPATFAVGIEVKEKTTDPLTEFFNREETIKFAGYGEDKLSTVLVTGTLFCHPPYQLPFPISDASVAVSCQPGRKTRQSYQVQSTTDEIGDFLIDLPSHLHGIPNLEKICCVSVLQLPKGSPCKPAFIGRHKGITLSSIGEGLRTYTAGTIQLEPKTAKISRHGGRKTDKVKAN